MILTRHMVGYEINNHAKFCLMSTFYEIFKFPHSIIDIDSQIGVDIIIISYCIRRSGNALDNSLVALRYSEFRIISLGSVTYETCIPYMGNTIIPYTV